jgi:hypothetical protein
VNGDGLHYRKKWVDEWYINATGCWNIISLNIWYEVSQAGRSRDRGPMRWIIFNWPNPSNRTMVLRSTQPLIDRSTRNLPWGRGKGRPARKANNLTAICEPIVQKMWEPRLLTTLWASMACYKDSFTVFYLLPTNHTINIFKLNSSHNFLFIQRPLDFRIYLT